MVREIIHDPIFLQRKSLNATAADLPIAEDLVDTLQANADRCVGLAANMIGKRKRIIAFCNGPLIMVMLNPKIINKDGEYETEEGCLRVLREFGLANDEAHVINGHTPIKVREGESPLKAGGKLVVIDGGFSRSFHQRTGIAGYTLIGNSHGLRLASHQPFTSIRDVLQKNTDIHSDSKVFFQYDQRFMINRTDTGKAIQKQIGLLQDLLDAYRSGWRPEA